MSRPAMSLQARAAKLWRNLPLLPLTFLTLLVGFSVYASISGGHSSRQAAARALADTTEQLKRAAIAPAIQEVNASTCSLAPADYKGHVILLDKHKTSADACWKACRHRDGCTAWTWCAEESGCTDDRGLEIPIRGCQLKNEPMQAWGLPSASLAASMKVANSYTGYIKHRKKNQKTFVRLHSAPLPTVMIAMYVPPSACAADKGDYFTRLSIMNKQDYVRWFSGELMIGTKTFDPSLRPIGHHEEGTWNKVGMMRKILEDTPPERAEWIVHMQPETFFDDTTFAIPFDSYRDKDLILIGNSTALRNGQMRELVGKGRSALDLGVFMIRNTRWSRMLLDLLAHRARTSHSSQVLAKENARIDPVVLALADLIAEQPDRLLPHIHFEGDYCLACDWRRLDLKESAEVKKTKVWGDENRSWNLFIVRFYDCELCSGEKMTPDSLAECHKAVLEHYDFSYCRLQRLVNAITREESTGNPLKHMLKAIDIPPHQMNESSIDLPIVPNRVLQHANKLHTSTDHECWEACIKDPQCNFWVWCASRNGCDEGGDFNGRYPYRGCELAHMPSHVPVQQWERGPLYSSISSGFVTERHPARKWVSKKLGSPGTARDRVAILTGIHPTPCTTPFGDYYMSLQLANKQDWARYHSYEVHQMAELVDSHLRPGPWQKVGYFRQALNTIPRKRAEWFIWLDMDMVLENVTFDLPLETYEGRDIIMWGQPEWIAKGDNARGLNTGTVIIRNSDWSRMLVEDMATYGKYPVDWSKEATLRAAVPTYDMGMYEQNVLIYRITSDPRMLEKMYFENAYCINCWYKDLDQPFIKYPPFVIHYAGCQMCTGYHQDKIPLCNAEFIRGYFEAQVRMNEQVAKGRV